MNIRVRQFKKMKGFETCFRITKVNSNINIATFSVGSFLCGTVEFSIDAISCKL